MFLKIANEPSDPFRSRLAQDFPAASLTVGFYEGCCSPTLLMRATLQQRCDLGIESMHNKSRFAILLSSGLRVRKESFALMKRGDNMRYHSWQALRRSGGNPI